MSASIFSNNRTNKKIQKVGKVAIVYSDTDRNSAESRNLAHYFCGLLSSTGYADIVMVPYCPDGPISDLPNRRVLFIPPGHQKPLEVPGADVTYAHWNALTTCHLIVVTVNGPESKSCGSKLSETLQSHKNIPIFSMQRGVKYSHTLSEEAESKGSMVIEAVVGFSVVVDPKYSSFVSTMKDPSIMFCRLSKEEVKIADGPLRLLETMDLNISFRKVLTPYSFGVLIYENIYALNILTKGTINDTLNNYRWRQVLALMVRENIQALTAASNGGGWEPSFHLIKGVLSPKLFELLLLLPNPFFQAAYWLLGLQLSFPVMSPGQQDLMEGRRTMTSTNLQELVDTAKRYQVACPVCETILAAIHSVEAPLDVRVPVHSYHSADLISALDHSLHTAYPTHDSYAELQFYLVRAVTTFSILFLLLFLFYHE